MKRLFLFICLFFFIFLSSCELDKLELAYTLNIPLGLKASLTNSFIHVQFWGYNYESFFSGYTVFFADNIIDLKNMGTVTITNGSNVSVISTNDTYRAIPDITPVTNITNIITNSVTNTITNIDSGKMTYEVVYRQDKAILYAIDIQNDTNYAPLILGKEYFIHVKAYSSNRSAYSYPSNYTNITFATN